MSKRDELDLVKGTLDVLVLKALSMGAQHGYAVARWIQNTTGGSIRVEDGALYTALHRMEARGWLAPNWGKSEDTQRRVKFYSLTRKGERALAGQEASWVAYVDAVRQVLNAKRG